LYSSFLIQPVPLVSLFHFPVNFRAQPFSLLRWAPAPRPLGPAAFLHKPKIFWKTAPQGTLLATLAPEPFPAPDRAHTPTLVPPFFHKRPSCVPQELPHPRPTRWCSRRRSVLLFVRFHLFLVNPFVVASLCVCFFFTRSGNFFGCHWALLFFFLFILIPTLLLFCLMICVCVWSTLRLPPDPPPFPHFWRGNIYLSVSHRTKPLFPPPITPPRPQRTTLLIFFLFVPRPGSPSLVVGVWPSNNFSGKNHSASFKLGRSPFSRFARRVSSSRPSKGD